VFAGDKVRKRSLPIRFFKDYQCYVNGQKAYNGVSICSRKEGVPVGVLEGVESRTLGLVLGDTLIVNVYAPHGDLRGSPRFSKKSSGTKRSQSVWRSFYADIRRF